MGGRNRGGGLLPVGLVLLCLGFSTAVIRQETPALSESEQMAFEALDSQLLVKVSASQQLAMMTSDEGDTPDWKEDGFEPYTDEMDSFVSVSGLPDPLNDDMERHNRYQSWLVNYKRIKNEPKQLWSYTNADTSPDVWSSLEQDYAQCDPDLTKGKGSPIDIPISAAQPRCYGPSFPVTAAPQWDTTPATLQEVFDRSFIVDVAHCKLVGGCDPTPSLAQTSEHGQMMLERVVFHTPSEHTVNGAHMDMELQFMHCLAGSGTAHVNCQHMLGIAVLIKDGGDSAPEIPALSNLAMTVRVSLHPLRPFLCVCCTRCFLRIASFSLDVV